MDGNHQWVQGVGAVDSDVVDFASDGQTGGVAVGVESLVKVNVWK